MCLNFLGYISGGENWGVIILNFILINIIILNLKIIHPFRVGTHPATTRPFPLFEVSTTGHKPAPSITDFSAKNYVRSLFSPHASSNRTALLFCISRKIILSMYAKRDMKSLHMNSSKHSFFDRKNYLSALS